LSWVTLAVTTGAVDPVIGWVTRIEDRLFRVNRWIESRALRPEDDITEWLGRTMARVHQLQPLDQAGLPDWWRTALKPRSDWEEWFTEARRRGEPWSEQAWERLPRILELTARIEEVCETAPDLVMTHGDFKSHNMLMTSGGPVLIDWDSVRSDSAALEAGRIAHMFGSKTLDAYDASRRAATSRPGPDHPPTDRVLRPPHLRSTRGAGCVGPQARLKSCP
jgi:aminoglycoside phosphotransferase (APT) family kinase protein